MAVTAGAVMLLFLWGAVALAAILNGDKLPAAQTSSVAGNTLSTGKTTAATTEKVTRADHGAHPPVRGPAGGDDRAAKGG